MEGLMPSLNRIQLIGRLGKEPEVRSTPKGKQVCTFSLAVSRRWKSSSGETKESTDWFNIEAWGHLGEICKQYLRKGRLVFLEGQLRTDRYDHEGDTRYYTKVVATQMQMLDRKAEELPAVEGEEPSEDEEFDAG
jgi:single-strand DNA-binding protein